MFFDIKELKEAVARVSLTKSEKNVGNFGILLDNLQHVKMYVKRDGGHIEMVDGSIVPLARRKKDYFMEVMNSFIA